MKENVEEIVRNMRIKVGDIRFYMNADLKTSLPRPEVTDQKESMTEEVCQCGCGAPGYFECFNTRKPTYKRVIWME